MTHVIQLALMVQVMEKCAWGGKLRARALREQARRERRGKKRKEQENRKYSFDQ
jgi:hypothetical protein